MPKQNRPVVRDGRLQTPTKKRTDRSYLPSAAPTPAESPTTESEVAPAEASTPEPAVAESASAASPAIAAFDPPAPASPAPAAPATAAAVTAAAATRSSTQRALEQQGVRKRREVDIQAVAKRDSDYAKHELRRIAILTTLVVVALIVLTLTLR